MDPFNNLQLNEIISFNKSNKVSGTNSLSIGILRNITIDNYLPLLNYLLIKENYTTQVLQGDYDVVFQEVLSQNTRMANFKPDVLILFLDFKFLSPNLYYNYTALLEDEISQEKESIMNYLETLFVSINKHFASKIIFHLFELPSNPAYDIAETQNGSGQRNIIQKINTEVISFTKSFGDFYFVDLNLVKEKLGIQKFFDKRYWFIAKSPFTLEAAKEIAIEHIKILNSLYGKTKKCLVLDCDNTLWGGILGEDGFDNIKIGKSYPGNMFLDFQKQILNLYNKGIILAINSKNNEEDVLEVLDNHPDMVLRKNHFACIYANWENKADNIRNIAIDLNIGLDSLVFVDDSEFECSLVREKVPEVKVINLPKEAYKFSEIILNCGLFDRLQYTNEDKNRGELYKVEVDRKNYKSKFTDINSYFKSLEMVVTIELVNEFSISRVSQLTQRTNQFNLTTKRYSEEDIRNFMTSDKFDVLTLSLADKFGDMGIVGVQIIDFTEKENAKIDSFMMSCRIIGRGVENVFLKHGLEKCFNMGFKRVVGCYIETKKNNQVANFYMSNGFYPLSPNEGLKLFALDSIEQFAEFEDNFNEILIKQ